MATSSNGENEGLVTRMLRTIYVRSNSYDFDEVLKRFERRFGAQYATVAHGDNNEKPADKSSEGSSAEAKSSIRDEGLTQITIDDVSEQFAEFFAKFCRITHARAKMESSITIKDDKTIWISKSAVEVSRQVLRRELCNLSDNLAEIDLYLSGGKDTALGHRAIVASLKRQVRESRTETERLQRLSKKREIENRNLRDEVNALINEKNHADLNLLRDMEEKERLRSRLCTMKRLLEDSAHENKHLYYQRKRLERSVDVLRKELVDIHHEQDNLRLEHQLLQSRAKELSLRRKEASESESIIVARVRELELLQEEMLVHMRQIDRGNLGARGALDALNQKRNRLLERIHILVVKHKESVTDADESHADSPIGETSERVPESLPGQIDSHKMTTFPGFSGSASESNTERPPDRPRISFSPRSKGFGVLQRKISRAIFPNAHAAAIGDTATARATNATETAAPVCGETGEASQGVGEKSRQHRKAARYAGTRAHTAAIAELGTLREIIDLKEKEIQRMESELDKAHDRAEGFERQLHKVWQARRKENRNLHGSELEEAADVMDSDRESRCLHNTMFDWTNNAAPGDGELTTKIPSANASEHSCVELNASPISEKGVTKSESFEVGHELGREDSGTRGMYDSLKME